MTLLRKTIFKILVFKMYFLLNLHKHIYYRYKADQKVELQIIDNFFNILFELYSIHTSNK